MSHRNTAPPEISPDEFRKHDDYMFDSRNYYVKGATFNYCSSQQISVAISKMQGLTNSLRVSFFRSCKRETCDVFFWKRVPPVIFAKSPQFERALACQIIMLAPIAPHFASELWSGFVSAPNQLMNSGEIVWDKDVLEQKWPEIDKEYNMDIVCQVEDNWRFRAVTSFFLVILDQRRGRLCNKNTQIQARSFE